MIKFDLRCSYVQSTHTWPRVLQVIPSLLHVRVRYGRESERYQSAVAYSIAAEWGSNNQLRQQALAIDCVWETQSCSSAVRQGRPRRPYTPINVEAGNRPPHTLVGDFPFPEVTSTPTIHSCVHEGRRV